MRMKSCCMRISRTRDLSLYSQPKDVVESAETNKQNKTKQTNKQTKTAATTTNEQKRPPPLLILFPFSQSLIRLMVSVDVKHHAYLLTYNFFYIKHPQPLTHTHTHIHTHSNPHPQPPTPTHTHTHTQKSRGILEGKASQVAERSPSGEKQVTNPFGDHALSRLTFWFRENSPRSAPLTHCLCFSRYMEKT